MSNVIHGSEFVTDTVGIILWIEQRVMGQTAEAIFNAVELGRATIYVPAMLFAEILRASEKGRISFSLGECYNYLKRFPNYKEYPMNFDVVHSASQIADLPELHDRLIAGTARLLNLELVTNDQTIQASSFVKTVW